MEAKWYDNPDCTVKTEAGRRAYFNTFYASASGRQCLCHITNIAMALPEDTPTECKAKMTAIGLVNTIKQLAGVNDGLAVVEAEGRVADRSDEGGQEVKTEGNDIYEDLENG